MVKIAASILELVGNTPLVDISAIARKHGAVARVVAKLESFNPMGSVKDRIALGMVLDAEKNGKLTPGGRIVEPTSGNTGIGLAWVAACRGYKATIVMPDTMSVERRNLLKALGAEVVLTPGAEGMSGAIKRAEGIAAGEENAVMLQQFENPSNPSTHVASTGPEIWNDTDGGIDILVAGVGTGGSITGISKFLKQQKASVKAIAVEPKDSQALSGGKTGPHKIQGLGAGFIPAIYDSNLVDEIVAVGNEDAFSAAREIAREAGILVGISSGAALCATYEIASRKENQDKLIVCILPDTGERYLSTQLFTD